MILFLFKKKKNWGEDAGILLFSFLGIADIAYVFA
jgi:hypothetical protein